MDDLSDMTPEFLAELMSYNWDDDSSGYYASYKIDIDDNFCNDCKSVQCRCLDIEWFHKDTIENQDPFFWR